MRFAGKVAIVTGAASGIGRATALRLAVEGASVWGFDRDEAGLASLEGVRSLVGDVSARADCFDAVRSVIEAEGGVDVVANVAGVLRAGHFTDASEADVMLVMGVNALGPFWMCQAAVPSLLDRSGSIVNVASNAGVMGAAYLAAYCASKGAVVQLTKALAVEYERTGLRVNAVCPGGVSTPMTSVAPYPDDVDWKLVEPIMSKRGMSSPEEIAAVIAFLASDDAAAIHGAVVAADEGLAAG